MKDIVVDSRLIAYCGLYCGACGKYIRERCPGCRENEKASWCKARTCCKGSQFASCADCGDFRNPNDCRKFNNWISKIFAFIFRSDRAACIGRIRQLGLKAYAAEMAENKRQSIKR